MSSWFGIPTINSRLDRLTEESASLVAQQEAFERHVRNQMTDVADDLRTSLEDEFADLQRRIARLESRLGEAGPSPAS